MSKILVTGSQGTIGRPLVLELMKRGHEVWQCDLAHHYGDNYIRADVSKYRQLERLFDIHKFNYVRSIMRIYGRQMRLVQEISWSGKRKRDSS